MVEGALAPIIAADLVGIDYILNAVGYVNKDERASIMESGIGNFERFLLSCGERHRRHGGRVRQEDSCCLWQDCFLDWGGSKSSPV